MRERHNLVCSQQYVVRHKILEAVLDND